VSRGFPDTPLYRLKRRLEETGHQVELGADYTVQPRHLVLRVDGVEVARAETDNGLATIAERWLQEQG
jgi:hypothetical protein